MLGSWPAYGGSPGADNAYYTLADFRRVEKIDAHMHIHGQAARFMAQVMRDASICGLGQTAASALESAMQRWSLFS